MADNVAITAGTGTTIAADEVSDGTLGSVKVQYVKIMDGTLDGTSKAAVGSNGLKVDGSGATQPVSGTITANIGTSGSLALDATLTGGTQKTKLVDTGGTNVASISAGGALKVDGSGATQPVSGTVTANAGTGNFSTNVAQLAGTTTDTNSGAKSAGTLRVVLATDQPQLTNKLLVTPDANSAINIAQVAGGSVATGHGTASGALRVELPTDGTGLLSAAQSGTWTVQPGNTPNTSPWLNTPIPATSGGLTTAHVVSAASTNATNVKASAGQLFGYYFYNSNAAARKIAFHNTSGTPTAGASVFFSIVIPPTSGANVEFSMGITFSSGIAYTMVTGLADSDATSVALNDIVGNLWYK